MSKILDATCNATGQVTVDGIVVPAAQVLSEGKQASEGLAFFDGEKVKYLPSSATDIKTTIERLVTVVQSIEDAVTQIATTLTSIGAGMTGPTTSPPPTLPADVVIITGKVAELAAARALLDQLKGALK